VIAGRDPQLEKAIEIALAELAKSPPVSPKRPPFPLRARPRP
jgi:tricorn protease